LVYVEREYKMGKLQSPYLYMCFVLVFSLACAIPSFADANTPQAASTTIPPMPTQDEEVVSMGPTSSPSPVATEIVQVIGHLMMPADAPPAPGRLVFDIESSGTGSENRAPGGDSYNLNLFERPFLQDMTYVPDMDIHKFGLSQDGDWYYITIHLIGDNPNNPMGINFGVEIDLDLDGFGDYILWAAPPYPATWDAGNVQVFKDTNRDTAGLSALRSDVDFNGDGYDTLIFEGSGGQNADPDLVWVRMIEGQPAIVQFAFKKSLTGSSFMLGVVADAGLKDVSRFDYADSMEEAEAGSPIRRKSFYPLGALFSVDNTCWNVYGIQGTGYEPKACQPILQPVNTPESGCNPPPNCGGGPYNPVTCGCL
jgi:hypothetical protein